MTTLAHANYLRRVRNREHLADMDDRCFATVVLPDVRAIADALPNDEHGEQKRALLLDLIERYRDLVDLAEHDHHPCPGCGREWVEDRHGMRAACDGCARPEATDELAEAQAHERARLAEMDREDAA